MKRGTAIRLVGAALVAGVSFSAYAELKENPYQIIIERNPFGLKEILPPPPPPDNTPPPPPPPDIKLTGITTLLGPSKVFLEFTDPQTKKTERPPAMTEGDTFKDTIKILSIDAENNIVKIMMGEKEMTLDFVNNGIKPGGGAVAAAPAPQPGFPGVPQPPPSTPAAAAANLTAAGPARGALVGGSAAAALPTPGVPPGGYNPAAVSSLGGLPPRPVRTEGLGSGASLIGGGGGQPATVPAPRPTATPAMTHEQAQAMIEARRMQLEQQNNPQSRILPPTPLGRQLKQQ